MALPESFRREVSLFPNERIIMKLQRRYPSIFTSILSFGATAISIGLSSFFRYVGQYPDYAAIAMDFLYLITIAIAALFAFMALVGYFYVQGHLYILTNRRIILLRKFIAISVREIAYSEVTDIIVNQGPVARLLNYGSVTPLSPGVRSAYTLPYPYMKRFSHLRVSLKDVNQPSKVMSELFKLTRSHS